jgi:hypothetical protein
MAQCNLTQHNNKGEEKTHEKKEIKKKQKTKRAVNYPRFLRIIAQSQPLPFLVNVTLPK